MIQQTCGTLDLIVSTVSLVSGSTNISNGTCGSHTSNATATVTKLANETCLSNLTLLANPILDGETVKCSVDAEVNGQTSEIISLTTMLRLSQGIS